MMIQLSQGYETEIDFSDWWKVQGQQWWAEDHPYVTYAVTKINGKITPMQNLIKPPPDGMVLDHADRNGLNNRWNNLRFATHRQNILNTVKPQTSENASGYRGVTLTYAGTYQARIRHEGKNVGLGTYDDAESAARAYDAAAKQWHGEFAVLNFPVE